MGQYKVPQDVEAEDKIIGFLTLKQFIYSVIGVVYGLLSFQIFKSVLFIWVIVGVPPTLMLLLLGLYQRDGQPFEAYFLAMINYWFQPRRRVWLKEDLVEVFKIEQPKPKPHEIARDPREVWGQLGRLAELIDTRGASVKRPEVQESFQAPVIDLNDRLTTNELAAPVAAEPSDVSLDDDMLNLDNPAARNLTALIDDSTRNLHTEAVQKMHQELPPQPPKPAPGSVAEPENRKQKTEARSQNILSQGSNVPTAESPLHHLEEKVLTQGPATPAPPPKPTIDIAPTITEMTTNPIADILKTAMENTDLKVSQVSQIAAKAQPQSPAPASPRPATPEAGTPSPKS